MEGGGATPEHCFSAAPGPNCDQIVTMRYVPCPQVGEMAADISESGGHDCKGDPRGNIKLDADYPLRVLYCGGKCWKAENGFSFLCFYGLC